MHKSLIVHLSQVITSHLFTWSNITIPKSDAATEETIFFTPHFDHCFFPLRLPAFSRSRFSSVSATRGVAKRPQRRPGQHPSLMGKTGYGARRDQGYTKNQLFFSNEIFMGSIELC